MVTFLSCTLAKRKRSRQRGRADAGRSKALLLAVSIERPGSRWWERGAMVGVGLAWGKGKRQCPPRSRHCRGTLVLVVNGAGLGGCQGSWVAMPWPVTVSTRLYSGGSAVFGFWRRSLQGEAKGRSLREGENKRVG